MRLIERSCSCLPGVLLAVVIGGPANAATLTVPDPYPTIQLAILVADHGDEVVVSPGVYFERIDLEGKAITLRSVLGPKSVVIDGQGLGAVITLDQGEGPDTVIEGLTVTGSGSAFLEDAMFIISSAPTVRHCRFVNNAGSGMYIDHSSPLVSDCEFTDNTGGGLVNIGDNGSRIVRCTFTNNQREYGGAIINVEGVPAIMNCEFRGNRAVLGTAYWSGNGGAIFNQGFTFARISNCLFIDNIAERAGGAVYNEVNDRPEGTQITNCTFVRNEAPAGAGAAVHTEFGMESTSVRNCILWDHAPDVIVDEESVATTVSMSAIEGGWTGPGGGNVETDPKFVDVTMDDYRLQAGSPAIDAGDNTAVADDVADLDDDGDTIEPLPQDLDGNDRFRDDIGTPDTGVGPSPIVDMGAYEFQGTSCVADLDESGAVDFGDLLAVLSAWGPCAACPADLDRDDAVGFSDLVMVLASWGPCAD